jgi:hypothetical protein
MSTRASGVGVVLDFYFQEMLTPYRSRVGLRTFQSAVYLLYAVLLPFLLIVASVVFLILKPLVAQRPGAGPAVLVLYLTMNLYLVGSYLVREMFTERRYVVADAANASFYRAFDLRARDVFVIYSGLRTTAFYLAVLVVDAAFVAVFHAAVQVSGPGLLILLGLPLAGYAVTLAVSAAVAVGGAGSKAAGSPALVSCALALLALGYGSARFVVGPIVRDGLPGAFAHEQVALVVSALAVAVPVLAVSSLLALGWCVRRLARVSFPIRTVTTDSVRPRDSAGRLPPVLSKVRILHRELSRSKVYPLVRRNVFGLSSALLLCLGASASGAAVLPVEAFAERFRLTYHGVAFVSLIVLVALVLTVIGPATFAAQFRQEWENLLLSRRQIATSAAVCYVLPAALLGCGFSVLFALLAGVFSVGPVALAVSVAAAAMIAESTVAPREMADGSTAPGPAAALVVLVAAAPAFAAVSAASPLLDGLAVVYSLGLLAGGITCMIRRIQPPSRSAI